jgi:hypothetical protein
MIPTDEQKRRYWGRVEAALRIYDAPRRLSSDLRKEIENLSPFQQELFYHAEPLDIATDLAGIEQRSDHVLEAYLLLESQQPTASSELIILPSTSRDMVTHESFEFGVLQQLERISPGITVRLLSAELQHEFHFLRARVLADRLSHDLLSTRRSLRLGYLLMSLMGTIATGAGIGLLSLGRTFLGTAIISFALADLVAFWILESRENSRLSREERQEDQTSAGRDG